VLTVDLPAAGSLPPGYVHIPAGRFLYGSADDEGLRRFLMAPPQHEVETGAYLIGRNEVTFAEYLEFLRALSPEERVAHLPKAESAIRGALALEELRGGRYRLTLKPASTTYTALDGEPIRYLGRDRRAEQDWRRFPVAAISWIDARAYLAWLSRTGRLPGARFCTEHEWERAARGADDRIYPHGRSIMPDDANIDVTYDRKPENFGPDEVGAHGASDSPFGVKDLVGNVWEWTESIQRPGEPAVRGGSYYQEEFTNRSTNRDFGEADARDPLVGLRVCAGAGTGPAK
jgi:formylglycine-generating enzyme required for sulfatase activity